VNEKYLFSVIAYNGAVDHVFTVYELDSATYKIVEDRFFVSFVDSIEAAWDEIEAEVDENGWIIRED
jgi:hypothetical protein